MTERTFVVDIEPRGSGGWQVWISEVPYRGVETDTALHAWKRQRVGGTYTTRRLVGRARTGIGATWLARRAVASAGRTAARSEREQDAWRVNSRRAPRRVIRRFTDTVERSAT